MKLRNKLLSRKVGSINIGVEIKNCADCDKGWSIDDAIATIASFCKRQQYCAECKLFIEEKDSCFFSFSDLPCDWEVE